MAPDIVFRLSLEVITECQNRRFQHNFFLNLIIIPDVFSTVLTVG